MDNANLGNNDYRSCKYCHFEYKKEPFTERNLYRGEYLESFDNCVLYIERFSISIKDKKYSQSHCYYLVFQYEHGESESKQINFCPMCGLEFRKIS